MPVGLSDRAQDGWEPLLALADLAGGTWPQRARAAAVALSGNTDATGMRERLLADLREIVDAARLASVRALQEWRAAGRKGTRPATARRLRHVRSADLVAGLLEMEGHGWTEHGRNRQGITPDSLAGALRAFGIAPATKRVPTRSHPLQNSQTEPAKVYEVAQLRSVFRRYLS